MFEFLIDDSFGWIALLACTEAERRIHVLTL